jgi:glycosyltransferase involved in cell wall biosynthesis
MISPGITIVTPVRNGLPYIRECVESVLAQEFQNWEMLISDNHSSDGTAAYLRTITDPRIRVFFQKEDLGICGNLNFLFKQARSPYCQILCADDHFWSAGSLSVILDYWGNADPEIGFAGFNHVEDSDCLGKQYENSIVPSVITPEFSDLWFFVFGNFLGNISNVSLRTSLVAETGHFDQDYPFAGDFEFWIRAARKVKMGIRRDMVVYVRRHQNTASNYLSRAGELYPQHIRIYEKLVYSLSKKIDRKTLIGYYNYEVSSFHYRTAIRSALYGDLGYLRTFLRAKSAIDLPKWIQVFTCFPFVLFNRKQEMTVKMAKKLIKRNEYRITGTPVNEAKVVMLPVVTEYNNSRSVLYGEKRTDNPSPFTKTLSK